MTPALKKGTIDSRGPRAGAWNEPLRERKGERNRPASNPAENRPNRVGYYMTVDSVTAQMNAKK